jgi:glycosyltransferase involved in cell wall biosynthesis
MRIAQIAPPWLAVPPKGYGGVEWIVSLLSDGLVARGHDVTLFATGDSTTAARLEYVFEEAPGPPAINDIWHDTVHTLRSFRDVTRFDLIHAHSWWSQLVAGANASVPTVHTLHTAFWPHVRAIYEQIPDDLWYVAISEAQRRQMPELRYAGVVYNGIDLDLYPLHPEKEDFLLFLGRTAPEKGMDRAILTARAAGLKLVCAVKSASVTERREWEERLVPMLDDDVVVLGEVDHSTKVDMLARAKAVIFPIDWEEPFGLVMTEAMASGTPVIATPRGSVPEIVVDGETGFIVELEDFVNDALDRLGRLGEIDPKVCRARVEQLFSKDAMISGYELVYERVLAEGEGTAP